MVFLLLLFLWCVCVYCAGEQWSFQTAPGYPIDNPGDYVSDPVHPSGRSGASLFAAPGLSSFFLFGGESLGGLHNDLWEYTLDARSWTYIAYADDNTTIVNTPGEYVDSVMFPGSRTLSASWMRSDNQKKYVFGGRGCSNATGCPVKPFLSDLWLYDASTWTHLDGGSVGNEPGSYSGSEYPGARHSSLSVRVTDTDFYLYSGYAIDGSSAPGCVADVWKLDVSSTPTFSFEAGQTTVGTFTEGSEPAPRKGSSGWVVGTNQIYIFGGQECDNGALYNDLWVYNLSTTNFFSIGFTTTSASENVTRSTSTLSSRSYALALDRTDNDDSFLLFGGYGFDNSGTLGHLRDLWVFSIEHTAWLSLDSYDSSNLNGDYSTNLLGGRSSMIGYSHNGTDSYLFGGYGLADASSAIGGLTDIWELSSKTWSCFGTPIEFGSLVCSSGNGNCLAEDYCSCNGVEVWSGVMCEIPICYGLEANASGLVCSGRGECNQPNNCSNCDAGYVGLECNVTLCFSERSDDMSNVCSGNGNCIFPDICDCGIDWGGDNCSIPRCNGILANDTSLVCSGGKGVCELSHVCSCSETSLWGGDFCEFPVCGGIYHANESNVCNGTGECQMDHLCLCDNPMEKGGDFCDIPVCDGILGNMTGSVCYNRGTCISPNQCKCTTPSLWGGDFCNVSICDSILSSNTSAVCSGRGTCRPNLDECTCETDTSNWGGSYCDEPKCFGETGTVGCSGFSCISPQVCSCNPLMYSEDCSHYRCFGIAADNESYVCNTHGECTNANECNCTEGTRYFGRECREFIGTTADYDTKKQTLILTFRVPSEDSYFDQSTSGLTSVTAHHFHCSVVIDNFQVFGSQPNCAFSADFATLMITPDPNEEIIPEVGTVLRVIPVDADPGAFVEVEVSYPHGTWYIIVYEHPYVFVLIGLAVCCCMYYCTCCLCCCLCCCGTPQDPKNRPSTIKKRVSRLSMRIDTYAELATPTGDQAVDIELIDINDHIFSVQPDEVEVGYLLGQQDTSKRKNQNVYKSEWRDRPVAYRVIKQKTLFHPKNFSFLEKELSLASALNHPNIIQLLGCTLNKPIFQVGVVMEFLENGNLLEYFTNHKKDSMEFQMKVEVLKGVCAGMQYLHDLEIVHRGLQTSKVFLTKQLHPKVNFDFGIDNLLRKLAAKSKRMEFIEEGHYVAPEITLEENVTVLADVFSMGMIMFECLTEDLDQFGEETGIEQRIALDPSLRPQVDEIVYKDQRWFVDLMRRCWCHVAERRPTFQEIKQVLVRKY